MILALDVATTTGWAYGSAGERPQYGHFRAGKRGMKGGEIVTLFRDWLKLQCEIKKPHWLIYESPYVPRVAPPRVRTATGKLISTLSGGAPPIDINVLRRLITLCGIVEELGWRYSIEVREEASNVVCRQFTGRGSWGSRAAKKAATQKMCAVYGWHGVSEDEADALALWVYAEAMLYPELAQRRGCGPLFVAAGQ
jgi:hypothetical protein